MMLTVQGQSSMKDINNGWKEVYVITTPAQTYSINK